MVTRPYSGARRPTSSGRCRFRARESATPIVWGDQVFVVAAIRTDRKLDSLPKPEQEPPGGYKTERPKNFYRFEVLSLDRRTGKTLWQKTATEAVPHEGRHDTNTYASASPSTDGERLYVSFGSRGIYCYDLQGNLQWKRDLGQMVTRFGWGEGLRRRLYGDSLGGQLGSRRAVAS